MQVNAGGIEGSQAESTGLTNSTGMITGVTESLCSLLLNFQQDLKF